MYRRPALHPIYNLDLLYLFVLFGMIFFTEKGIPWDEIFTIKAFWSIWVRRFLVHFFSFCIKESNPPSWRIGPHDSYVVNLAEVRRDLEEWKEAIEKEYQSLRNYNAIVPISEEQYNQLQKEMEYIETIPAMLVTVVKPPCRKKARIVACGNHSAPNPEDEMGTTAGGLDSIVARVLVSMASERQWRICSSDISTAFLQAERGFKAWKSRNSKQPLTVKRIYGNHIAYLLLVPKRQFFSPIGNMAFNKGLWTKAFFL